MLFLSITLLTLPRDGQYNSINYANVFFRSQPFITNKFKQKNIKSNETANKNQFFP
jgi:hypothetical protein